MTLVFEKRKSYMTETTSALSEFEATTPTNDDGGEPDYEEDPLVVRRRSSSNLSQALSTALELNSSNPSLLSLDNDIGPQLRIHRIRASKRLSAPELASPSFPTKRLSAPNIVGFDSMPNVPTRRGSHASLPTSSSYVPSDTEDDTMREDEEEDDPVYIRPVTTLPPTLERRLSDKTSSTGSRLYDSERRFLDGTKDAMTMPVRQDSAHTRSVAIIEDDDDDVDEEASEVVSDSQNNSVGGTEVTDDQAIEDMILSQIPEHIRNQMTPEMWKQIFTVNAINKHSGASSVCSELTDDLASRKGSSNTPNTKRRSIDHAGIVEEVPSSSTQDFVKENLESHSTFRSLNEETKDDLSAAAASDADPPRKKRPVDAASSTKVPRIKRPGRRQENIDAPPSVPKKKGSLRSDRAIDMDIIESSPTPSSGRRVPKKRQYSVRFSPECYIRNHERILDVHPSTSSGPSLGLGWNYYETTTKVSWCSAPTKRGQNSMLLSRQTRERMMRVDLGYSPKEIAKAVRENLKIKNQRRRTVNNLQEYGSFAPVEKVEYLMEKCQRKLGKLVGRKSSSTKPSS